MPAVESLGRCERRSEVSTQLLYVCPAILANGSTFPLIGDNNKTLFMVPVERVRQSIMGIGRMRSSSLAGNQLSEDMRTKTFI